MAEGPGVQQADGTFAQEPLMDINHAADEVVHIVELPLSVNSEWKAVYGISLGKGSSPFLLAYLSPDCHDSS
jgi:hypothetical protein